MTAKRIFSWQSLIPLLASLFVGVLISLIAYVHQSSIDRIKNIDQRSIDNQRNGAVMQADIDRVESKVDAVVIGLHELDNKFDAKVDAIITMQMQTIKEIKNK